MPETITIPYPAPSAELIIYWAGAVIMFAVAFRNVSGIAKTATYYQRTKNRWIASVLLLPLIPSLGFAAVSHHSVLVAAAKAEKQAETQAKMDAQKAFIDAIPDEWDRIIKILHTEELRTPAKMGIVKEHIEGHILPDLTVKQQNYIIESTFECGPCGCGETCERNRDQLSGILAVYVNPFTDET